MTIEQACLTDEQKWHAVKSRTAHLEGVFNYAVRTMGIYCLSGCPSRRPDRENVEFFDNPKQAEQAGYRACKRCKPNQHSA